MTLLYPSHPIAISVSDTPDAERLGVWPDHAWDVLAGLATELLATGVDLAYGGDLRQNGFTERLLELTATYQRRGKTLIRVTNCLAWPVHIRMPVDELTALWDSVKEFARLVLMDPHGSTMSMAERLDLPSRVPSDEEWRQGLTDMRTTMVNGSSARVVVAGQVDNYMGTMPGIAEEVLLSLRSQQPVYLVGGAGGCTRDIAESMGVADSRPSGRTWADRHVFESYSPEALNNGLTADENHELALTPFVGQAVNLVMLGLYRLYRKDGRSRPHPAEG